ncbi:MAG: LytTR family transcriptional regulator DNA-binding domain-containing protein, partial [Sphingomonadales bacterium]|nr:LytTR family transcriptional regulator DNA-binding domain-containing protein [Sphingomonadales bacterium]
VVGDWGSVLATTTLKGLAAALPGDRFVQTHRSYIVNRDSVVEQRHDRLRMRDGSAIPIGRSFRSVQLLK